MSSRAYARDLGVRGFRTMPAASLGTTRTPRSLAYARDDYSRPVPHNVGFVRNRFVRNHRPPRCFDYAQDDCYFPGGGGGGGGIVLPPSSAKLLTGAQPAQPGRQACVSAATWPLATMPRRASSVYGPYVLPSMASDQRAAFGAPGGGGGVADDGGGGAADGWPALNAPLIACPMATPAPRPTPAPARPPGFAAAM